MQENAQLLKMPASHYEELRALARNYWWHRTRRELILNQARAHLKAIGVAEFASVIDVGCGSGTGSAELVRDLQSQKLVSKGARFFGVDHPSTKEVVDADALKTIQFTGADLEASNVLPSEIVSSAMPRLWVCTDVLEHLKNPAQLTASVAQAMSKQDLFICTVPAFQFLWSRWDEKLGHLRRYTLPELRKHMGVNNRVKLVGQGHLFSWAVFPGFLRKSQEAGDVEFPRVPGWMNSVLSTIGKMEIGVSKFARVPFGTTAWIAVRKA